MRDSPKYLRIEPRITCQLLRIHLVTLAITVRDPWQLTRVRHKYFVTEFPQLFADSDRMRSRFHRDPGARQIGKPLVDACRCRSEPPSVNDLAVLVERAVMAPDISKVD